MERDDLYRHLDENTRVFRDERVRAAFEAVDRADFVDADYAVEAYEDYALPLGNGRSIAKPTLAAFMLELLGARAGDSVLEIGSGSGWVTTMLASIVGKEGRVVGVDTESELVESGRRNISKYGFGQASIEEAAGIGRAGGGPYDRVFCSGDADSVPQELVDQLKEGGVLVMPVSGRIVRAEKKNGKMSERSFPGEFRFDPLM